MTVMKKENSDCVKHGHDLVYSKGMGWGIPTAFPGESGEETFIYTIDRKCERCGKELGQVTDTDLDIEEAFESVFGMDFNYFLDSLEAEVELEEDEDEDND